MKSVILIGCFSTAASLMVISKGIFQPLWYLTCWPFTKTVAFSSTLLNDSVILDVPAAGFGISVVNQPKPCFKLNASTPVLYFLNDTVSNCGGPFFSSSRFVAFSKYQLL